MISKGKKRYDEVLTNILGIYRKKWFKMRDNLDKIIIAFKKYYEINQDFYLKYLKEIRSKPNPEAQVKKKRE